MKNSKFKIKNYGFVLLFALLVSSILLATGLGISRLMVRQISLASLSRESQVAFFAADSGLECALHWNVFGKFDMIDPPAPQTIYCNGAVIKHAEPTTIAGATRAYCDLFEPPVTNIIDGDGTADRNVDGVPDMKSCFTFSLSTTAVPPNTNPPPDQACAFVIVDKSNPLKTVITSNGYNKCSLSAPNILQRTLEISLVNQ